jgi:hypothetical protein
MDYLALPANGQHRGETEIAGRIGRDSGRSGDTEVDSTLLRDGSP